MSRCAANPAALPSLPPCTPKRAGLRAQTRKGGSGLRRSCEPYASPNGAAIVANFCNSATDENFASACVRRCVSRHLLGHCFGANPAPCGSASFCFGVPPRQEKGSLPGPRFAALRVMVPP